MKPLRSYFQVFALLLILSAGSSFAYGNGKEAVPAARRAAQVTQYLTHTLRLRHKQQAAVEKCTREYLQQLDELAAVPEMLAVQTDGNAAPRSLRQQLEEDYTNNMARILTPGQYNAYSWLQKSQPRSRP